MTNRRYIIVIGLTWALVAVLAFYMFLEPRRLPAAQSQYVNRQLSAGRVLYAENCANCHGPAGEGVVGPPLNRSALRGQPTDLPDTFTLITSTVSEGRPGSADPRWVRLKNGAFASYTGMNAWSQSKGGSLNQQQIEAIATFIMLGDWHSVAEVVPPPILPTLAGGTVDRSRVYALMPDAQGLSSQQNQAAKELLRAKTCIQCHTVGRIGGQFGPDLTKVGTWGIDQPFLEAWIKNPPRVKERAPRYWSNYGAPPLSNLSEAPTDRSIPLGHPQMPVLALSEQEVTTLAAYLSRLK